MNASEKEFLIVEFEQAWAMILAIDERRLKFVEFHTALFGLAATIAALLVGWRQTIDIAVALPMSVVLGVGVLGSLTIRQMILSERAANLRYRHKINLIRGLFLAHSNDTDIAQYLTRGDLGVRTGSDPQPSGAGSTLSHVMRFLYLETALMAIAIVGVWAAALL